MSTDSPRGLVLSRAVREAPFVFVAGKGGVGKTTAAAALALDMSDEGLPTHLISTDPAHSLCDVFATVCGGDPAVSPCSPNLLLEEFDAQAFAARWLAAATEPVTRIIEAGTYLDGEDVAGFARLALPGVDELMAVLRLVELAPGGRRVVVDTAPTGHTLRLLDAGATHAAIADALHAMADKAAAVASSMVGRTARVTGEEIIGEMRARVRDFHEHVLAPAAFVVVTRDEKVVAAETERLLAALQARRLRTVAVVVNGADASAETGAVQLPGTGVPRVAVPMLEAPTGCDGLRQWLAASRPVRTGVPRPAPAEAPPSAGAPAGASAVPWLESRSQRLLLFAGKGGVGKSTCAAAAALVLARTRDVLLCSTDPAGSLDDVLGVPAAAVPEQVARLRVQQIDAESHLARLREQYRESILGALERVGLSDAAALDRRVIEALWDLAPPGIDEFAALAAMLGGTDAAKTVVLDTAPTGHFLRLLSMPDVALDWTRQLMRLIVKYRAAGVAGGAAESLLQAARELRGLQEMLHDPARCGVIAVTRAGSMVQAETARLLSALDEAGVAVAAVLYNGWRGEQPAVPPASVLLLAPQQRHQPAGIPGLEAFMEKWKITE